jgi:predicted ATP-dependent serine protease
MNDKHKWTCENCGAENEAGLDVCHDCGWDKFSDDELEDYEQSGDDHNHGY